MIFEKNHNPRFKQFLSGVRNIIKKGNINLVLLNSRGLNLI